MDNFYQKFLLKVLAEKINKKLIDNGKSAIETDDAEAVFSNIDVLYNDIPKMEFGSPTGEVYRYLNKEDKVTALRIISPTASLTSDAKWDYIYPDEGQDKGKKIPVIRGYAKLLFDRNDINPVAEYRKIWEIEELLGKPLSQSDMKERANVESLARGLCETRCLSRFGIGEWFTESDPEKDYADKINTSGDISVCFPDTPKENTSEDVNTTLNVNVDESSIQMEIPFTVATPANEPIKEEAPKKTTRKTKAKEEAEKAPTTPQPKADEISITLEEAREIKATVGLAKSKGYTLGHIADDERMKITNLRYIYANSHNALEKAAIKKIALNDDVIKASFDQGGIPLD